MVHIDISHNELNQDISEAFSSSILTRSTFLFCHSDYTYEIFD